VTTAGFGDSGQARTTKSVVSCISLVALNMLAGFLTIIRTRMMTMKPVTSSARMPSCLGEYVSISGQDSKLHTFRVIAVPVVMSMALTKSF
jgi:hypothetical protein